MTVRGHSFTCHVGPASGGEDSAPGPHDYFDAALAACPIHKLMTTADVQIETVPH